VFREARQGNAAGWAAYISGAATWPSFDARGKVISTNEHISLSACPNFLKEVPVNLFYCPSLWSRHRRQIIYNNVQVWTAP